MFTPVPEKLTVATVVAMTSQVPETVSPDCPVVPLAWATVRVGATASRVKLRLSVAVLPAWSVWETMKFFVLLPEVVKTTATLKVPEEQVVEVGDEAAAPVPESVIVRPSSQVPSIVTPSFPVVKAAGAVIVVLGAALSRTKSRLTVPVLPAALVWEAMMFLVPSSAEQRAPYPRG